MISIIYLSSILPSIAYASESVPLPPKRPSKMSVSPAYIEELRNRSTLTPKKVNNKGEENPKTELESDIVRITSANLAEILEGNPKSKNKPKQFIPTPSYKPEIFNNIEPAAAPTNTPEKLAKNDNADNQTTLVSFSLHPKQTNLDKNLELFLTKHAITLLRRNKELKMEIQAYATEIQGQPHSDVRISLARALEVRRFLISNNINPSRLKLSPEGKDNNSENSDRIDLLFIKKQK